MATVAEQWLERGRTEATLQVLQHYLATRFNVAPNRFDSTLSTLDLPTLNQLSDAAFKAESLADFETALRTLVAADAGNAPVDEETN